MARWYGRSPTAIGIATMIASEKPCAFCAIIAGELAADIVHRDDDTVAFLDKRPVFPGHVLVVPTSHVEMLGDVSDELLLPLMRVVRACARAMESGLEAEGSFVAQNNRVSQSVPHVHVHVIPRRFHDGLKGFFWPRTAYADDAEREAYARVLRLAVARELGQD